MSATTCIEGETIHMLATADTPVDALDKDGFDYSWSIVNEATEVATVVDNNTSNTLDYKCTVLGKFYIIVTAKGAYTGSGTTAPATAYAITTNLVPAAFDSIDLVQTAVIGEEVTLTVRISDTHTSDMKTLVVCWIAPGKQAGDSITVNAVQLDAKGRRVQTRRFIEKHIYNELGTFSVKITVVDSAGCATVTHRQITIIPALPTVTLVADRESCKEGETLTLTATATVGVPAIDAGGYVYVWSEHSDSVNTVLTYVNACELVYRCTSMGTKRISVTAQGPSAHASCAVVLVDTCRAPAFKPYTGISTAVYKDVVVNPGPVKGVCRTEAGANEILPTKGTITGCESSTATECKCYIPNNATGLCGAQAGAACAKGKCVCTGTTVEATCPDGTTGGCTNDTCNAICPGGLHGTCCPPAGGCARRGLRARDADMHREKNMCMLKALLTRDETVEVCTRSCISGEAK
eukprot:18052-Heterococcus_DN1.PRE.1